VGDRADVIVVGAGLMGAATAWAAARRGLSVTVIEQFAAGHALGSSHGSARIVRRAYGDSLYTQLSGRAFELWRELELETGTTVLRMLGGIDFGARRDPSQVAAHLAAAGVDHELLDAAQAQERWPGMRFTGQVVYHRQAGAMDADLATAAFLGSAAGLGALIRHGAKVAAIASSTSSADGARVDLTDGTTLYSHTVVVAAGAWIETLLGGLAQLPPLRVTQQQVFHFPRLDVTVEPWPSVIHDDAHGVYHLAGGRDGGPGDDRKIGEHDRGKLTTADGRDGLVDPASRARVIEYVRRWLPGLDPVPSSSGTCLYTSTPSEDFILDRVGPIVVCSPCSGHGAKFAPLIGERAIGLVTGEGDVPERFRLRRHLLGARGSVSL
jgi:sarcosine oxidase